ncbi:MAG TPA: hypothetical protein PKU97_01625 [Kofleriaceae bacterium]|nr:hypothetical protein [Kofleriaceae bacterium]
MASARLTADRGLTAGRGLTAEPGTVFIKPMWVDDQDVWIATGVAPYAGSDAVDVDGVLRRARASLDAASPGAR